ncbi:MAG TPA: non-homologous end-joining DNA ligase [Azospirillaceae bacterium]|nr:non-homologous end-joining DNA ligase [Azospirillaceae bacterium]
MTDTKADQGSDGARLERAAKRQARAARGKAAPVTLYGIPVTHPEKMLWQDPGVTKRDLVDYYSGICAWILPHLDGRPLSLKRCPSGPEAACFIQKHAWPGLHEQVHRVPIAEKAGVRDYLVVDCLPGLVALLQGGVVEIHPWGATVDRLERPDRLVLDFDPAPGVAFADVVAAAREARERLAAAGLASFVRTTGGKGLHVVAPLEPTAGWAQLKDFAEGIAASMAADQPDRYTTSMAMDERDGRIFIDYLRNTRGASAVASYSVRARDGAPVAMPVSWEALDGLESGARYTIGNARSAIPAPGPDPWEGFFALRQALPAARKGQGTARPPRRR